MNNVFPKIKIMLIVFDIYHRTCHNTLIAYDESHTDTKATFVKGTAEFHTISPQNTSITLLYVTSL